MIALILAVATGLALLAPPGPEGVILGALFTAATLGGTLLGSTFLASAAAFTLNVIVGSIASFALNKVVSALAGKPKAPKVTPFGVQASLRTGGDVPRSIILGRGVTAGSLVWANAWRNPGDTPNEFLVQVIALSDMPIHGVVQLFVNGQPVSFADPGAVNSSAHGAAVDNLGSPITQFNRNGRDHLWLKVWTGNQTVADNYLVSKAGSAERPWQSTRVGTGVAYAVVTSRFNRDLFTGVPQFRFECIGVPLYDIARDGTAGGVGAHRWDTPSTWAAETDARQNAGVILYNLLRGIRYGGEWVMGLQGVAPQQLPNARWVNAINAAYGADFRAGGEVSYDTELGDTVEALLASCIGRLTDNAGTSYGLSVGAPGSAVASFTDDDIISTAEQSFTPFGGLADTVNGVIFTYPRPSQAWASTQAPPLYDAALEAEDGGRRLPATIDMPMVWSDEQAQRLAKAALAEARRARRHTITLPPQFWPLEPGDVVSWTSARNGYVTKLFRVDGIVDLPDLDVLVDLTEVDPSDYAWNVVTDYSPPVDGFLGAVLPPVQSTSVSVAPYSITVAGVGRRPAIELSWVNAPSDVLGLDWQVRIAATAALVAEGTAPGIVTGSSGSTILSSGLVANTGYQVRARWVPGAQRLVDWSSWLSVTTPDVRLGVADFASTIEPVGLVTTGAVPTAKSTEVIYHAPTAKLYRWNGSAYTAAVETADLLGQVIAQQIADGSVTASKLLISDTQNLLLNGDFAYALEDWSRPIGGVLRIDGASLPAGSPAPAAVRLTRTTTENSLSQGLLTFDADTAFQYGVPCSVGDQFYAEAWVHSSLAGAQSMCDFVQRRGSDSAFVQVNGTRIVGPSSVTANTWTRIGVVVTATAAGRIYMRLQNTVNSAVLTVTRVRFSRRNTGELIVDGAVTASKIAAGAVETDALAANSIVAGKVAAGAIGATQLAADQATIDKFAANNARIKSANIDDLAVGTIKIANGAAITDKIAAWAVTDFYQAPFPNFWASTSSGSFTNLARLGVAPGLVLITRLRLVLYASVTNGDVCEIRVSAGGVAMYQAQLGMDTPDNVVFADLLFNNLSAIQGGGNLDIDARKVTDPFPGREITLKEWDISFATFKR